MPDRFTSVTLAWLLWGLTCALSAIGLVFLALSWSAPVPDMFAFRGHAALLALPFGLVGQFLARRRPRNSIGWLFLVVGLVMAIQEFGQEYSAYVVLVRAEALPGTALVAWVASWIAIVAIGGVMFGVFVFPTGFLPSRRWRPIVWLLGGAWATQAIGSMLKPGPLRFAPYLINPFGNSQPLINVLMQAGVVGLIVALVAVGVSLIVRLRHARGIERQQLKWFTYFAALTCGLGLIYVTGIALRLAALTSSKAVDLLAIVIPLALPIAVWFAILRYHLYEIDRVINRTLVYGLLTLVLGVVYFVDVVLLRELVRAIAGAQPEIVTVLSTLVIAALFVPVRCRIQTVIDRRFYHQRYDAARILESFGAAARDEVDLERLSGRLLAVVHGTVEPAHVSLWLRLITTPDAAAAREQQR